MHNDFQCRLQIAYEQRISDLDFCKDCHELPEAEHNVAQHTYYHPVVKISLIYLPEQSQRMVLEVESILEQLQQEFSAQQRSNANIGVTRAISELKTDIPKAEEISQEQGTSTQEKDMIPETQEIADQKPDALQGESIVPPVTRETSDEAKEIGEPVARDDTQEKEDISQTNEAAATDASSSKENIVEPSSEQRQTDDEKVEVSHETPSPKVPGDTTQPTSELASTSAPVVTKEATLPVLQFICGRCSETISLESEFFRCVGSTCQSALLFCLPLPPIT